MGEIDPYSVPAGRELDQMVHQRVMHQISNDCPFYSTDDKAARRVLAQLKASSSATVITGQTSLRKKRYFARYETDASDGTEVLADTLPLAICRLALLRAFHDQK